MPEHNYKPRKDDRNRSFICSNTQAGTDQRSDFILHQSDSCYTSDIFAPMRRRVAVTLGSFGYSSLYLLHRDGGKWIAFGSLCDAPSPASV